jgi:hypothetical protein
VRHEAVGGFALEAFCFLFSPRVVVSGRQAHLPRRAFRVSGAALSKLEC